jgi:hypothetical protein
VIKFETPRQDVISINFNDEKTSLEKILRELSRGGLAIKGKPVYLN